MNRLLFLFLFSGLISSTISAQHYCGFDDLHQSQMQSNPAYQQAVNNSTQLLANLAQYSPNIVQVNGADSVYEVPVVVHIIHTGNVIGGLYNPTDADVQDMIDVLNEIYSSTVPGWPTTSTGGVDMKLRFKLAQRTPNCLPTNGINRVDGSFLAGYSSAGVRRYGTVGPADADVKSLSRWDHTKYYNIWIVSAIDGYDGFSGGGVAGYASLPFFQNPNTDGTVMLSAFVNDDPDDVQVCAHELGHAFGLLHTFEGDNGGSSCPTETSCATQNDEVCDTEPHIRSFGCPTGNNTCTGTTYNGISYNIMNYTNCVDRFTPGQRTRLVDVAENYRSNLIHSATAEPIPTLSMTASTCTPTISNSGNNLDVGPVSVELAQIKYESDGYTNDGDLVYVDNTCISQTTLIAGQTYTINVGTEGYAQKVKAYIDYNSDGTFAAAEEILSSLTGGSGSQIHSASFTVPTTATSCTPLRMRVVSDRLTSATPGACSTLAYGQAEDYAVIIEGTDTVGIQITTGSNPSCPGTALTFDAVTNSLGTVTYEWDLNGTVVATGTTYSTSTAVNGDVLTLIGYAPSLCTPGAIDTITSVMTILRQTNTNVQAALNILQGNDTICAGDVVHLETVLQNGTSPTYQWMVGGTSIGTGTDTLQYMPANGDAIYCMITDMNSCFNGTISSDTIIFNVSNSILPVANITFNPAFPICQGENVDFVATVNNEGPTPTYTWFVNSTATSTGSLNFSSSNLNDADIVRFVLTSSLSCATDPTVSSNIVTAEVNPILPVTASTTFIQGDNIICNGDPIVIQGMINNGGASPSYDWFLNNVFFAAGNPMTFNGLNDGDVITLSAESSETCVSGNPASANETIIVNQYPSPLQISLVGNELRAYPPATQYQWYGPNGIIVGATSFNYTPTINGQYYCVPNNPPCEGSPSNVLEVYVLGQEILDISDFEMYPNPADNMVTLKMKDIQASQMYMLNALGQRSRLDYQRQAQGEYLIDVSEAIAGFYVIEVHTADAGVQYIKLQIQR